MGKRKERRLAAMSAAGRRVKLDLFAEPPGEMVDKSSKDEIRGDPDHQDHHAGVPISPSTSAFWWHRQEVVAFSVRTSLAIFDQNQENPLLLLGQYSDDEANDDANGEPEVKVEGSLSASAAQEGEDVGVGGNAVCTTDQASDAGNIQKDVDVHGATNHVDGKDVGENGIIPEAGQEGADLMTEDVAPAASTMQIIGDVTDGWKIVMHEQTNQYYYWNTLTGETSWEVPDVLSHGIETSSDQKASLVAEETTGALVHVHASIPQLDTGSIAHVNVTAVDSGNDQLVTNVADTANAFIVGKEDGASGSMDYDSRQAAVHYCSTGIGSISYPEVFAQHSFASLAQTNALAEQLTSSRDDSGLMSSNEVKDKHLFMADGSCEATEVHSARLVKYGESLLQRLKMLNGSDASLQRHDWLLKCILEVETRVSDCKALFSYGSSLLPFWWHTEAQLKRIESIIDQEGSIIHHGKSYNKEIKLASSSKSDSSLDSKGHELGMKDNMLSNTENMYCSDTSVSKEATEETSNASKTEDASSTKIIYAGHLEVEVMEETARSPAIVPQPPGGSQEVQAKVEGSANSVSATQLSGSDVEVQAMCKADTTPVSPKIESSEGEDVDMDVEMEVDEEMPTNQQASGSLLHLECPEQPEQPVVQCVAPQDIPSDPFHEVNVPLPPDEEWIPPPPPEDEAIPPPPPEEPPIQSIPPPPYAENVPSFTYTEQYSVAYPMSAYEYYAASMSEAPSTTYYPHVDASHVEPQPSSYYDPVTANSFAEANLDANATEPVVYYDVPVETVPPIPVASSLETSGFYIQSGPASYNNDNISSSDNLGSVMISKGYTSYLPTHEAESNLPSAVHQPDKVTEPIASVSITSQTTAAALVNGTSSDTISTANVKNQAKVARGKKRTVAVTSTLRSNKKVSSLVDKWKAAKEELHGDEEDESENAYEFLEKKRQKEIEEWKTRQIASGEAQDNANFLPLGGDWRERVKRRRAEANAPSTTQTPPEEVVNEKQQPDLVGLSKDLPSGWQAYWDESSREVYYGNAVTSETTWVRPSR